MAVESRLDTCSVATSSVPSRSFRAGHAKRRCCEALSATPPPHQTPKSKTFLSQWDTACHSTGRLHTVTAVTQDQHSTELEGCLQPFVTEQSKWWDWKYSSRVHYRQKGSSGPCILLVHGFGVGSFHFEQLMQMLSASYQVWAIDLLGQGMSWPTTAPAPGNPSYNTLQWS